MSDGQRTYLEHCTSCHDAYEPHEYQPATWRKAVSEMEKDHGVKLTSEDKALILGYVTGNPRSGLGGDHPRKSRPLLSSLNDSDRLFIRFTHVSAGKLKDGVAFDCPASGEGSVYEFGQR